MADIPAALRKADLARFALRASQLERAYPVVAYWCNYWIVEQILAKGLQNENEECMAYSVNLMDQLEKIKAELSDNDAVSDDLASQAYIEEFGSETFQRALNAMNANKASRQTADTFLAASTFLELRQIWGPLDPEAASKIKFAKYHALRIAKALKAGEDPNLSNPAPKPSPNQEEQLLSPGDPDVQMLDGPPSSAQGQSRPGQPFVEEIPDEDDRMQRDLARSSTLDRSLHPSRATSSQRPVSGETVWSAPQMPSPQGPGEDFYHNPSAIEVSPIMSPTDAQNGPQGGGYFPTVPDQDTTARAPLLPQVPPDSSVVDSFPSQSPSAPSAQQPYPTNSSLHSFPLPRREPGSAPSQVPRLNLDQNQQPSAPSHRPNVPMQPTPRQNGPVPPTAPTQPLVPPSLDPSTNHTVDEEDIMKAQKHARWAISALNFEDVKTAVKELRSALESLGA